MDDPEDDAPVSEEWLCVAAQQSLAGAFDNATAELVGFLRAVGHDLAPQREVVSEALNALYVAPRGSPSLVGFDLTISAFQFGASKLVPAVATPPSADIISWQAYSAAAFRQQEAPELALKLQRALEVEMLRRLWHAAHDVAASHDVPRDPFSEVDISDEGESSLDFCAFRRRLHLGFSFIATVQLAEPGGEHPCVRQE